MLFAYKAVNSLGETEEGVRDAVDEQQLIADFAGGRLYPYSCSAGQRQIVSGLKAGHKTVQIIAKRHCLVHRRIGNLAGIRFAFG